MAASTTTVTVVLSVVALCIVSGQGFQNGTQFNSVQRKEILGNNEGLTSYRVWICSNTTSDVTLTLTCPNNNDWFHVSQEVFSSDGNCTTGEWRSGRARSSSSNGGLMVNCVGPQNTSSTCEEDVAPHANFSSTTEKLIAVEYKCVKDGLNYNICGDLSVQVEGTIFLASPHFFGNSTYNNESRHCRCTIQTRSVPSLRLLYVANASDLDVLYNNSTVNSIPPSGRLVNEDVVLATNNAEIQTLEISFEHSVSVGQPENSGWIQMKVQGPMNLQCNGHIGMTTTALPPLSPTTPASGISTTSSAKQNHDSSKQGVYLYILGALAGILLLIVLVIVVTVIISGRNKQNHAKEKHAESYDQAPSRHRQPGGKSVHHQTPAGRTSDGYCEVDVNAGKARIIPQPSTPHTIYYMLEPDPKAPQEQGLTMVPMQLKKKKGSKNPSGESYSPGLSSNDGVYKGGDLSGYPGSFAGPERSSVHNYADVDESAMVPDDDQAPYDVIDPREITLRHDNVDTASGTAGDGPTDLAADVRDNPNAVVSVPNGGRRRRTAGHEYEDVQIRPAVGHKGT